MQEEVEKLRKDSQEKQELLCQASKAMELLDEQQKVQFEKSESTIDALNEKVQMLTVGKAIKFIY